MAAHAPVPLATLALMLSIPVDRGSITPPYRQVAAWIIAAIRRGEYPPGTRLPSVDDLIEAAGIAERTARKALHAVADEGLAELAPGMGWYVPGHSGGTSR